MPIDLLNPNNTEDQDPNKKALGPSVQTPGQAQGAMTASGGAPKASQPTIGGAQAPSSSGRFTNVQGLIKANQGNKLNQTVQQGTVGMANRTQQDIGQAQQATNEAIRQNTLQYDPNKLQDIVNRANTVSTDASGQVKAGISDADTSEYQRIINAQYAGPQALQDQDKYSQKLGQIQSLAKLAGQPSGQQELLKRFVASGAQPYSQGQQNLDALLFNKGNVGSQLARQSAQTGRELQAAQANIAGQVGTAQDITSKGVQTAQTLAQNPLTQQIADLDTLAGQRKDAQQSAFTGFNDILNSTGGTAVQLTPEIAKQLGLTQGQFLGNLSPDQIATYAIDPSVYNRNTVASQEDLAKYKALNSLLGKQGTDLADAGIGQASAIEKQQQEHIANMINYAQQSAERQMQQELYARYNRPTNAYDTGMDDPRNAIAKYGSAKGYYDALNRQDPEALRMYGLGMIGLNEFSMTPEQRAALGIASAPQGVFNRSVNIAPPSITDPNKPGFKPTVGIKPLGQSNE